MLMKNLIASPLKRWNFILYQDFKIQARKESTHVTQQEQKQPASRFYRAAVCTEIGKQLEISNLPSKDIKDDQVRVNIHAASINFADILSVRGLYQVKITPPFTPGNEFSGVVSEIGRNVKNVSVGSRVCALTFDAASYGEETVLKSKDLFVIPDNMSYPVAAGILSSYATAILALEYKGNIKKGDKVLVTAAAGATGLAAVDLAKNVYGAEVIGAAGGPAKCELIRSMGAESIDYNKENIKERVRSLYPSGADIVFEGVGGEVFKHCLSSLGLDGRLLSIGFSSQNFPSVSINHLLVKGVSIIGIWLGNYKLYDPERYVWSLQETFRHFTDGKIHPRVGKTFKLEEVNEAYQYIEARKNTGKIILTMQE